MRLVKEIGGNYNDMKTYIIITLCQIVLLSFSCEMGITVGTKVTLLQFESNK